jgi:hypothetical protein
MPVGMLPWESLVQGEAARRGVKYTPAGGREMKNHGEKRVKFKTREGILAKITFQAAEVRKPLAVVSRIIAKVNTVVFSSSGSYITNDKTGAKIKLNEENGTYVRRVRV